MKVVLLAGGLGTRISEESHLRPKPMIDTTITNLSFRVLQGLRQPFP